MSTPLKTALTHLARLTQRRLWPDNPEQSSLLSDSFGLYLYCSLFYMTGDPKFLRLADLVVLRVMRALSLTPLRIKILDEEKAKKKADESAEDPAAAPTQTKTEGETETETEGEGEESKEEAEEDEDEDDDSLFLGLRAGAVSPGECDCQYPNYYSKWILALLTLHKTKRTHQKAAAETGAELDQFSAAYDGTYLLQGRQLSLVLKKWFWREGKGFVWKVGNDPRKGPYYPHLPLFNIGDIIEVYVALRNLLTEAQAEEEPEELDQSLYLSVVELQDLVEKLGVLVTALAPRWHHPKDMENGIMLWISHFYPEEEWSKLVRAKALGNLQKLWLKVNDEVGYFFREETLNWTKYSWTNSVVAIGLMSVGYAGKKIWRRRVEQLLYFFEFYRSGNPTGDASPLVNVLYSCAVLPGELVIVENARKIAELEGHGAGVVDGEDADSDVENDDDVEGELSRLHKVRAEQDQEKIREAAVEAKRRQKERDDWERELRGEDGTLGDVATLEFPCPRCSEVFKGESAFLDHYNSEHHDSLELLPTALLQKILLRLQEQEDGGDDQ